MTIPLSTDELRSWWECEGPHHNNEDPIADLINSKENRTMSREQYEDKLRSACEAYWNPDPKHVSKIKRGSGLELDYVDHATVTRMLIEVDPYWEWGPMGHDENGMPIIDTDENGNPRALWIWIMVLGRRIPAVGTLDRPGAKNYGDALKELIGDAIRNGAMRFGICGGLWARGKWDDPSSTPSSPTLIDTLGALNQDQRAKLKEILGFDQGDTIVNVGKIIDRLKKSDYDSDKQDLGAWIAERSA